MSDDMAVEAALVNNNGKWLERIGIPREQERIRGCPRVPNFSMSELSAEVAH